MAGLRVGIAALVLVLGAVAVNALKGIPRSPYFAQDVQMCMNGTYYGILGQPAIFPSTPYLLTGLIFSKPFKNPGYIHPKHRSCRPDGHCMSHYEIDVKYVEADVGCPAGKTTFTSYGGTVPGPTFMFKEGEEIHARFNNKLAGDPFWEYYATEPCDEEHHRDHGIGISVHNHGQASLAPYDGWAEDWTCPNESKDYLWPGQHAKYGWYHDHGLDITSLNAYHGQAGLFIPSLKKTFGGCGEPWNLDDIPDYHLVLGDVTLNKTCQLVLEWKDIHFGHFFGDINLVSGTTWPVLTVHPTFVRLRLLAAGPSRPWHLTFVTHEKGVKTIINTKGRCKIIASEVGFFPEPVDMPDNGMFMGVGERYELVCDFSDMAGKEIILWNQPDYKRIPEPIAVPFFCWSHLLMKINVLPSCPSGCKFPSTPLKTTKDGKDLICGTSAKQTACCPDGQFCMKSGGARVCRSRPLTSIGVASTATCWLPKEAESYKGGMRCGGKCFRDKTCKGKSQAEACCPEGQFCWFKDANHWMCRANPAQAPKGTKLPALPKTCNQPKPNWSSPKKYVNKADAKLIPEDVLAKGMAMAKAGKAHREFSFGRDDARRRWVINNQTWQDYKFTTEDVGQNTWEVWKFYTDQSTEFGRHAFHPLHMHLVDFHILRRTGEWLNGTETYENVHVAKDMVNLHPASFVWVLVRFGPHRGDFMFHCHNTRHEDMAMLTAMKIIDKSGQKNTSKLSAPLLRINKAAGVLYDTYGDPDSVPAKKNMPAFEPKYLQSLVDKNLYRLFYPTSGSSAEEKLLNSAANIWKHDKC